MTTGYFSAIDAGQRLATPMPPVVSFFTPTQRDFRDKQKGYYATPLLGAKAPVTRMRRHPTGAASMDRLEADGDLYRAVMGDYGRPTAAGRR